MPIQGIQQRAERAEQCSIQPANFIVGFDLVPGITLAHGVTEQHAPQAKAPGIGLQSVGHAKLAAALLIQPPAHPGTFNPASQGWQVLFAQRETTTQRWNIQQIQYFTDRQATVRQAEQMFQCDQQRLLTTLALVGQGKGNMPRISRRVLAEDRLDMRGVGIHVRDHDDDIPRPELRVTVKGIQQLVVQNLDFALRAVSQVELDRAIVLAIHGGPAFAGFRQRAELQHILLQLLQQRAAAGFLKQIDAAAIDRGKACLVAGALVMTIEQVDIVAALLTPGSQQGMRMLVQGAVIQLHRTVGPPLLAPVLMAQQVLVGNNIAPMVLAGIQHTEQHLTEAANGGQGFQGLGW